jgi:hypothetical protein
MHITTSKDKYEKHDILYNPMIIAIKTRIFEGPNIQLYLYIC